MTANLAPAARIVAGMESSPLSERMADVLRTVSDVDRKSSRMLAYSVACLDHRGHSLSEIHAADEQAVSIELARRLNGSDQ